MPEQRSGGLLHTEGPHTPYTPRGRGLAYFTYPLGVRDLFFPEGALLLLRSKARPPYSILPLAAQSARHRQETRRMSKADFINTEWQGILARASRAASGFAALEEHFLQLRSDVMATYDDLKREVGETKAAVASIVAKVGEVSASLKEAQAKLEAGQTIDYSELTAELDAAQAEISGALAPTPAIEEVAAQEPQSEVAPPVEPAPAEPTP